MTGTLQTPRAEVGLLLYPGGQTATIHGMTDLMHVAGLFSLRHGGPGVRISHWQRGDDGAFSRAYDTHPELGATTTPDVVLVPGRLSGPMRIDEAEPYLGWLRDLHARGATLASNCGGAFVLAATGLLSGRPVTTHWIFAELFREQFPDVRLEADRIIIDDGDIITTGGFMAWTVLGLRLVERLLGPTIMVEASQCMLIDPAGREQRHYSRFSPRLTHGDEAILKVQHWLQAREARAVSVPEMAKVGAMEERTFLRRFKAATGMKPTEYAQHLRISKARELLEFTRRSVEQIAWAVGYEDAAAFRKLFHRTVGLSPGDYRQRFAVTQLQKAA